MVLSKAEIKHLPKVLLEHETIERFIAGTYSGGYGMLVATSTRLIFIDKKVFELLVDDIPFSMIAAVEYDIGMFSARVTVFTRAKNFKFSRVTKSKAIEFTKFVEQSMLKAHDQLPKNIR